MATARREFQQAQNRNVELYLDLKTIEDQIDDLETRYLERTSNSGNILIGWNERPHYHHHHLLAHPKIKLMPKDKAFSLSSVTSSAYSGLLENTDNKQINGTLQMRFINPDPHASRHARRAEHEPSLRRRTSLVKTKRRLGEILNIKTKKVSGAPAKNRRKRRSIGLDLENADKVVLNTRRLGRVRKPISKSNDAGAGKRKRGRKASKKPGRRGRGRGAATVVQSSSRRTRRGG